MVGKVPAVTSSTDLEEEHTQLATDSGYYGPFLAKCNSFLQIIPPSIKTNCPKKRKPVLTRSTWGRSLQTFCPQASCVSCW